MDVDFIRDHAMYAVIFGVFGITWFGWAQDNPPKSWRLPLMILAGVSLLVACVGGYVASQHWGGATVFDTPGISRQFGIIAGIEFATASVGAILLQVFRKPQYISAWIAFIVGLHFFPLVSIFQDNGLYVLAVLATLAPVVSVLIAKKVKVSVVALVGASTGSLLLLFAIRGLILATT